MGDRHPHHLDLHRGPLCCREADLTWVAAAYRLVRYLAPLSESEEASTNECHRNEPIYSYVRQPGGSGRLDAGHFRRNGLWLPGTQWRGQNNHRAPAFGPDCPYARERHSGGLSPRRAERGDSADHWDSYGNAGSVRPP